MYFTALISVYSSILDDAPDLSACAELGSFVFELTNCYLRSAGEVGWKATGWFQIYCHLSCHSVWTII